MRKTIAPIPFGVQKSRWHGATLQKHKLAVHCHNQLYLYRQLRKKGENVES